MIEFTRTRKNVANLPLTAMIDVVFILIIFFMLTSTFMRYESMELLLPSAGSVKSTEDGELARVIINNDGTISLAERRMNEKDLDRALSTMLIGNPGTRVVVFADDAVSMQKLVSVMDMVTAAGGKSLYVRPLEKNVVTGARQ